jgi:hypothetical protein
MVQKVVAVQTEENTRALDMPFLGQVHAPVKVFVRRIIGDARDSRAAPYPPFAEEHRHEKKRERSQENQYRAIPPRHRYGLLVVLVNEVVRVVGPEYSVVEQMVTLVRITKAERRLVHEKTMQDPLKERRKRAPDAETDRRPKNEHHHGNRLLLERSEAEYSDFIVRGKAARRGGELSIEIGREMRSP